MLSSTAFDIHGQMNYVACLNEVAFAIGVYTGIYLDQNYQLPSIDNPKELWKKIKEIANAYKKDNSGGPD